MGLTAKPKFSVSNKPNISTKQSKPLQPILAPKPRIVPPTKSPPKKITTKLGATTITSDSFDDMEDDDWGDNDKDLDDLLKD